MHIQLCALRDISLLSRYGFRGTPLLFVSARPKLGDRQVKLTHVTEWIEKKLKQEFRVSHMLQCCIFIVTVSTKQSSQDTCQIYM